MSATSDAVIRRSWMRALVCMFDIVLSARRWRTPRSTFVRLIVSINSSPFFLTHTVNTAILCWDSSVHVSGFHPFCPKECHHSVLFKMSKSDSGASAFTSYRFSHSDNWVLCDVCSFEPAESGYCRLRSLGLNRVCYSLNSQIPPRFWFTFVCWGDQIEVEMGEACSTRENMKVVWRYLFFKAY
jgi:hypothetical protein